jgi:uncharacterized protein (DUF433 family)
LASQGEQISGVISGIAGVISVAGAFLDPVGGGGWAAAAWACRQARPPAGCIEGGVAPLLLAFFLISSIEPYSPLCESCAVQDVNWAEIADSGLYTIPMAARLLAAKPAKVRSWVEGYGHSNATPILIRQLPRIGGQTVLGFLDLVESSFIRHFRTIGYSPQTIRKVALKLRDRHGVDHPFAMDKRFRHDGKSIFEEVVTDEGERRLLNLMSDNFVIVPAVEPSLFDQVFYVEDIAREWMPIAQHPRVTMNPKIAFGLPVLKDTWIPTETLFNAYQVEGGATEAAEEFGVSANDVLAAVGFEQELRTRTLH